MKFSLRREMIIQTVLWIIRGMCEVYKLVNFTHPPSIDLFDQTPPPSAKCIPSGKGEFSI